MFLFVLFGPRMGTSRHKNEAQHKEEEKDFPREFHSIDEIFLSIPFIWVSLWLTELVLTRLQELVCNY